MPFDNINLYENYLNLYSILKKTNSLLVQFYFEKTVYIYYILSSPIGTPFFSETTSSNSQHNQGDNRAPAALPGARSPKMINLAKF